MKRPLAIPVLMLTMIVPVAAQEPPGVQPGAVFRTGTNLVPLSVTVTDANKQFVKGLTANDFAVFEDGVRQDVQFFDASQVPLDLIILLDTSSSMTGKMQVVHEAAIGFVNTLRPGDRGAIVGFAEGITVLHELTDDRASLADAVRRTKPRGGTSLHNAVYIALKQFGRAARQEGDVRRQAIAVLSDGEDTSSLVSFDDVLALARRSGVSIYPIAVHAKDPVASSQRRGTLEGDYSMRRLAQETGALAFFPSEIGELKQIYATIAQELSNQYSIAYAPANSRADGRFRRINVRVTTRPDLRLRTRTGYTADPDRPLASAPVDPER